MKKTYHLFTAFMACVLLFTGCKKNELVLTYDANGGTGNMPTQLFEPGVAQALLPNAFLCDGYWFRGWNTAPDGSDQKYANQQIIAIKSDMTLYAQWRPLSETFFAIFYANGGAGSMENQVFEEGVQQVLNANEFTRTGYIFKGWNTKADGSGSSYRDKQLVRLYANLGLYAQWVDPAGGGEPCPGIPTVKDIDGNTYNTVQIGSQCWMRENLKTTKYATGENILLVTDNQVWYYLNEGAMCYYNNDASNAAVYGALYNGYTIDDGDLCPEGWHVPTNDEWNILANELGGANVAGYKMKTAYDWYSRWYEYDGSGSNESGFSAFPAGLRPSSFLYLGSASYFWSSTDYSSGKIARSLDSDSNQLGINSGGGYYGFSVRCIKD